MSEPITMAVLAAAAVKLAAPYVAEAAKAGVKKLGEITASGSAGMLWEKITARLSKRGAAEKVQKLEAAPTDLRRWAALEVDVEEALEADSDWRTEIERLVDEVAKSQGVSVQRASQVGYDNILVQVSGTHNQTTIHGRASKP